MELMTKSFFFYDLETSGLSPREDRIMQFAGIRTDMNLNQIGEPYDILVALNDDTLPSPGALMVTGISPQQTKADGYTEAQFAEIIVNEIFTEGTIAVGYNNVRFDDEFIRHLLWRNFRDPYEWAWSDGRSRWDLLDVVRLTRALRPEGIEWPVVDGKEVNKLELLSRVNGIDHYKAHDALSDVYALIAVTKLIKEKQPGIYDYLLKMRDKKAVQELANLDSKEPFVYASGRFSADFHKTTVACVFAPARNKNVLVYDLRHDPTQFMKLSQKELEQKFFASWEDRQKEGFVPLPIKEMQYNRVPAVAPLGVLESGDGWTKISLDIDTVRKNRDILLGEEGHAFAERIRTLFESRPEFAKSPDVEAQLYDGFLQDKDRLRVQSVAKSNVDELADLNPSFDDERLAPLLLHYKARSFPKSLSASEADEWEKWRVAHVQKRLPAYMKEFDELSKRELTDSQQYILQELQLWLESIAPSDNSNQDQE